MVIELVFNNFNHMKKSRWILNYSSMYISNKLKNITLIGRIPSLLFNFFNFSSDVHNKFHIELSQKHYPESTIFKDTRRISTIHETHTTETTRDHEDYGIMETESDFEEESLFEDIVCYILYLIVGVL